MSRSFFGGKDTSGMFWAGDGGAGEDPPLPSFCLAAKALSPNHSQPQARLGFTVKGYVPGCAPAPPLCGPSNFLFLGSAIVVVMLMSGVKMGPSAGQALAFFFCGGVSPEVTKVDRRPQSTPALEDRCQP